MIGLVLAAAGSGSRFNSAIPKQFTPFQGRPLYLRTLQTFSDLVDQVALVIPGEWRERIEGQMSTVPERRKTVLVPGGPRRQASVFEGLSRLPAELEIVLVHDAVRPFVSRRLILQVMRETRRHGACIPVLPVTDTLKEIRDQWVVRTLDRERMGRVQTPQGFGFSLLKEAFARARQDQFWGTDESVLVERLGVPVRAIPGEPGNLKVTYQEDLAAWS